MKKILFIAMTLLMSLSLSAQNDLYTQKVTDANGQEVSLNQYKGKVLLIVNTATKCGFTPQYKELEALYQKYKGKGFEILDFPCNQFGQQAPGSYEEIHGFCTAHFDIHFPQFQKVDVNGDNASPLFVYLKRQQGFHGFGTGKTAKRMDKMLRHKDANYDKSSDIKWNFTKFLVDRNGNVIARFEPTDDIKTIEQEIAKII